MLRRSIITLFCVSILFSTFAIDVAFAQQRRARVVQTSNLTEVWSTSRALQVCGPVPNWDIENMDPYPPRFTSREITNLRIETYDSPTLACMKTSLPEYRSNGGWGWVVMAAGSQYGFTNFGSAVYLGTPDGQYRRCFNGVLGIWQSEVQDESWTHHTSRKSPKEDFCTNIPDMTWKEAEAEGYTVTRTGKCIEPKEPECVRCEDKPKKGIPWKKIGIGALIAGGAFGGYKIITHHGGSRKTHTASNRTRRTRVVR